MFVLLLHTSYGVFPELGRHHLSHVATETVNAFLRPEHQNICHLEPSVRCGVEVAYTTGIVVNAIVQLYRLIPVVLSRRIVKVVIACSLGRFLYIGFRLTMIQVEIGCKTLSGTIVEIVVRIETVQHVVLLAKVLYSTRFADGLILAGHMIGYKIYDDLQTGLVSAFHQLFKLMHPQVDISSQVWVYIIIVGYGIGRASPTLHDGGMLTGNAVGRIVGLGSMTNDTCIPNMTDSHGRDILQHFRCEVSHLATTVIGNRAVLLAGNVTIAEKSCKYLVDNNLIHQPYFLLRFCA